MISTETTRFQPISPAVTTSGKTLPTVSSHSGASASHGAANATPQPINSQESETRKFGRPVSDYRMLDIPMPEITGERMMFAGYMRRIRRR